MHILGQLHHSCKYRIRQSNWDKRRLQGPVPRHYHWCRLPLIIDDDLCVCQLNCTSGTLGWAPPVAQKRISHLSSDRNNVLAFFWKLLEIQVEPLLVTWCEECAWQWQFYVCCRCNFPEVVATLVYMAFFILVCLYLFLRRRYPHFSPGIDLYTISPNHTVKFMKNSWIRKGLGLLKEQKIICDQLQRV